MFTLYNTLLTDIKKIDKKLTVKEKTKFLSFIRSADIEGKELCYLLIKQHYEISDKKINSEDLYAYKTVKNKSNAVDFYFHLEDIPLRLQRILYNFSALHQNKSKRDFDRNNLTSEIDANIKNEL